MTVDLPLSIYHRPPLQRRLIATLAAWRARRRERVELAGMTSAELRDAGITPYEARLEAGKPFWRA